MIRAFLVTLVFFTGMVLYGQVFGNHAYMTSSIHLSPKYEIVALYGGGGYHTIERNPDLGYSNYVSGGYQTEQLLTPESGLGASIEAGYMVGLLPILKDRYFVGYGLCGMLDLSYPEDKPVFSATVGIRQELLYFIDAVISVGFSISGSDMILLEKFNYTPETEQTDWYDYDAINDSEDAYADLDPVYTTGAFYGYSTILKIGGEIPIFRGWALSGHFAFHAYNSDIILAIFGEDADKYFPDGKPSTGKELPERICYQQTNFYLGLTKRF